MNNFEQLGGNESEIKPMYEFSSQDEYNEWVKTIKDGEITTESGLIPLTIAGERMLMNANEVGTMIMTEAIDKDGISVEQRHPELTAWVEGR